jgi:hypothetical protein
VNISIDDVTPHPRSSDRVIEQCYQILSRVPDAKFTLFVPTAYWRTIPNPPDSVCDRPLRLSESPSFCERIASLPSDIFEVGFHGHHHGIPGKSNNDELRYPDRDDAERIFNQMDAEVEMTVMGGVFKRILRPPAWRLSPGAFDAAVGRFDLLALHPGPVYLDVYAGRQESDYWKSRIVYQDAAPPIIGVPEQWDTLEIVTHACEWDKNYLSRELAESIADLMVSSQASGSFIGDLRGKV